MFSFSGAGLTKGLAVFAVGFSVVVSLIGPADLALAANKAKEERAATEGAIVLEGEMIDFEATSYSLKGRTASGVSPQPGMIAADPRVLPIGTVVHLRAGSYTGTYTVTDTGARIKGRRVDVYVPNHKEAIQFGRRQVKIKVVRPASPKVDTNPVSAQ